MTLGYDYEYPTDEQLETIEHWDWGDFTDWNQRLAEFWAYVKNLWWNPEWGWEDTVVTAKDEYIVSSEIGQTRRLISTGGWSGNESLIGAMQANYMFWSLCWVSSRRGGHYEFRDHKMGDT